jgi:deoxyribose-phosphate aldolase
MSKDELIERIVEQVLAARKEIPKAPDNKESNDCRDCGCGHCVSEKPQAVAKFARAGAGRLSSTIGVGKNIDTTIARMIDHTILRPNATAAEIEQLCGEALEYGFYSVCVNPTHIARCGSILKGSNVKICTVVGFPLGANSTAVKVCEARDAEEMGADEIDMVINIGALKDRELDFVFNDVSAVVKATSEKTITKVILENAYLSTEEKIRGCLLCRRAGADFVKTSTGFGPSGATLEDVVLMRHVVGQELGVKAAGGIRDTAMALKLLQAGATRIGASASVKIVGGSAS